MACSKEAIRPAKLALTLKPFVSTYKINKDKELNFSSGDEKTLESFLTLINSENKSVSTMHDKATAQEISDGDDAKIIEQIA